jgi:ABC-type cobalamin transport system permease subunit
MSDTQKTPSTADLIETGAVCVVVGVLVLTLVEHLLFGETWRWAAIRSAILAVVITTVVMVVNARKRRSRSTRS